MARKVKRKAAAKPKSTLDKRVEDFGEEVGDIGGRFGKRMERHGKDWERREEEWGSWFHRTLGVVGPLISSVIGVVILGLIVWAMSFVNSKIGSWFLTDITMFLANNIGVFFVVFLFFSYASYFSMFHRRIYRLFSPVSIAVAVAVAFWIAAHAINTANISLGVPILSQITFHMNQNLFLIFSFFLCLGYLVLAILIATEKTIFRTDEIAGKTKPYQSRETPRNETGGVRRLYRSGNDRILGGVCGGIAEYLGVDPVIIRLLWVVGTLAWGFGIILYMICWIIIPRNPVHRWK